MSVGEHLSVGEHAGRVTSVTLRGVELESVDGSRVFIPGLMLHTETITHGPLGARAAAVRFDWLIPPVARDQDTEELRGFARRLALLSPRRAPGTPVLVQPQPGRDRLVITMTPYDRSETDALRLEVTRRLNASLSSETTKVGPAEQGDSVSA